MKEKILPGLIIILIALIGSLLYIIIVGTPPEDRLLYYSIHFTYPSGEKESINPYSNLPVAKNATLNLTLEIENFPPELIKGDYADFIFRSEIYNDWSGVTVKEDEGLRHEPVDDGKVSINFAYTTEDLEPPIEGEIDYAVLMVIKDPETGFVYFEKALGLEIV